MAFKKAVLHLWLLPAILFTSLAAAACYNPDGSLDTDPAAQPCNQVVGTQSMCCNTNRTTGGTPPDTCEPNGLCLNRYNGAPLYWRGSCTERSWNSPYCLKGFCTSGLVSALQLSAVSYAVSMREELHELMHLRLLLERNGQHTPNAMQQRNLVLRQQ